MLKKENKQNVIYILKKKFYKTNINMNVERKIYNLLDKDILIYIFYSTF